jgi:hypothetical protein
VAGNDTFNNTIRKEIEVKYEAKQKFLEASLNRAKGEEVIHIKQEDYTRYDRVFKRYSFPLEMDMRKI